MALLVQQFEFNLFDVNQLLPLKTTVSGRVSYTNFAKQLFIRIRNTQAKLYKHSQYGLSLVIENEELMNFLLSIENILPEQPSVSVFKQDYPSDVRIKIKKKV